MVKRRHFAQRVGRGASLRLRHAERGGGDQARGGDAGEEGLGLGHIKTPVMRVGEGLGVASKKMDEVSRHRLRVLALRKMANA